MVVMVTGASGFVGKALVETLEQRGISVLPAYRTAHPGGVAVGDIDKHTNWSPVLQGVTAVVHTAARVHVMSDTAANPLAEFRSTNTEGTCRLAACAARAGVKRFVFLSSIKVNGEGTDPGRPYTAEDAPSPQDPYGVSKYEAEQALRRLAKETGMEVVIIRPPLVYGPGVKANFLSMIRWLDRGLPLPLGDIRNQRSLVNINNLTDLIANCLHNEAASDKTFLVSDNHDVSTTELLKTTAKALESKSIFFPIPQRIISSAATVMGKKNVADRLVGNLQVDISKTLSTLNWSPPTSLQQGIVSTVRAYKLAMAK